MHHFQQYFNYIMAVCVNGRGNWKKPLTCRKSLKTLLHNIVSITITLVVIGTDCTGSCISNYYQLVSVVCKLSIFSSITTEAFVPKLCSNGLWVVPKKFSHFIQIQLPTWLSGSKAISNWLCLWKSHCRSHASDPTYYPMKMAIVRFWTF